MIPNNRVVAHFLDGRVIKGTTSNFFPNRPTFHLLAVGAGQDTEVQCRQLKAVFFVKDLAGDENRKDIRGFVEGPAETSKGKKIALSFKDGEFLFGYSLSYSPERVGLSSRPSAEETSPAVSEIQVGPAAEQLAKRFLPGRDAA